MSTKIESKSDVRARMLSVVSDAYDKTEGSFFWDTLDPVADEITRLEEELSGEMDASFASTATGEDLDRVAADRKAIYRKEATKAVGEVEITGAAGTNVPIGVAVTSSSAQFRVTKAGTIGESEKITVPVMCTVGGTVGNVAAGAITGFGVSYTGMHSVTNKEPTEGGYDAETDEDLRSRLLAAIRDPGTSGNAAHYREWALSVPGVGGARVAECWNGNGTVKVTIISADHGAAEENIVAAVKNAIEESRPIGADVTVVSAQEKAVNISATVTLASGASVDAAKQDFELKLSEYLEKSAFQSSEVSYAKVGALLMSSSGVDDYKNLTINESTSSLTLSADQVGTVGAVMLVVG